MGASLTAQNLSFAYDGRPVLKGVSLAVDAGEFVGLIGANGSGKTTLLRALLGLLKASGEARLCGDSVWTFNRREIARRATMVHQDTRVDFAFTSRDIVAMGRTPYLGRFKPESAADKEAIARAMRETGITELAERPVTELSGGEKILEWQPDFLITGANRDKEKSVRDRLLEDPAVASSKAARAGRIIVIDNRRFLTVSHHVVRFVEDLANGLYGDRK